MLSRGIVKKSLYNYKLVVLPIRFKSNRTSLKKFNTYDFKLANSISRTKKVIYDYAINNEFKYFVTITCNDNVNSYNLDELRLLVTQIIRDLRKKYHLKFDYILIPEKHKKGDYHLHGFFTQDFEVDLYRNDHFYLSWKSFDKYGFTDIDKIHNYEASCKYITKYITKEFAVISKGKHLYYCSKGLKRSEVIRDYIINNYNFDFDYQNDYCSIKEFNDYKILQDYDNSIYNDYNSVTK